MPTPAFPLMIRTVFGLLAMLLVASVQANAAADDWWKVAHRLAPATTLDFTPHGTQPGLSLDLLFADQCFSCHAANQGDPATAFRPYTAWAGSMKANATRDPLFFAALDVANNDVPGAGDYCLRCHTARGWLGGHVVKAGFGAPNNDVTLGAAGCLLGGAYDSADDLDSDFGGVTCHFCHRLMAQGPNGEPGYLENDNAWVDDVSCTNPGGEGGGPCRHGPYNYPVPPNPPHEWVYSDYHTQSAICGLCHNVTSPDTNAGPLKFLKLNDGTPTTLPFPIERTFAEWQQSQYAQPAEQTCQSCHMPDSEAPNATACSLPGYPNRTGDLPVHAFVGGNTWIPGIIKGQYAAGIVANGGSDRSASYDQTITWARQLLGTAAAVATTIPGYTPPTGGNAGSMTVNVKITNLSGHKLPSGYSEGRRMWLNLQVHDANGGLVFESAAYNSASGVLGVDAQAHVYEVFQGIFNHNGTGTCDVVDAAGKPMFHFVASDCIAKDTRIPPLGFHPATAGDPNGYALRPVPVGYYPDMTPGTLVNYDSVNYTVTVPAGTVGPLTATARLYYQTSSKDYMEFLRDEAIANGTEGENQMCSGQADRPFTVGPQGLTRGEYVYQLWNQPTAQDRVFADGFDGTAAPTGSGKSPPELIQSGSATTP